MKKFITVHKRDYKNRVIIAIDDISCIFDRTSYVTLFLKSDPKFEIELCESIDEINRLINGHDN